MKEQHGSRTAKLIAAALVMLHAHPRYGHLVRGSSATLAERALEQSPALGLLKRPWFRSVASIVERLTIPGIVLHYALRKRCIHFCAVESITKGATQVVILGAGFDSLGADLQENFRHLKIWEVDHPATQHGKKVALHATGMTDLHLIPADLSKNELARIMSDQTEFQAKQPTLWIAEGLLMYFEEMTVRRIFEQAAGMSGTNSRFIFTFMCPDPRGQLRFHQQTKLVDWWLKRSGEPFRWGSSPECILEFIQPWRASRFYDADDLRHGIAETPPPSVAKGETICVAEL